MKITIIIKTNMIAKHNASIKEQPNIISATNKHTSL